MSYLDNRFLKQIDKQQVEVIFELGTYDLRDAITLRKYYKPKTLVCFECNPHAPANLPGATRNHTEITVVEKAVWDKDEKIKFYPVVSDNPKASSCFRVTGDYPYENYKQEEITVEAIRLDTWMKTNELQKVDLVCADVQGAILKALQGLGDYLRMVKYLICEIESKPIYLDEDLFPAVKMFLDNAGFELVVSIPAHNDLKGVGSWFGDFLFVKRNKVK